MDMDRNKKVRVWIIHDGDFMIDREIHNFVAVNGVPTPQSEEHVWWEEIGLFTTKRAAEKWMEVNMIPSGLWVHSMTVCNWMLDMAKEEKRFVC